MKTQLISLLFLIGISANCLAQKNVNTGNINSDYSIESASRFIEMAKAAKDGQLPDDKEWHELFATEGYHQFFSACYDTPKWQSRIRNAFELVFDKKNSEALDSILTPTAKANPFSRNYYVINFHQTRQHIDELYKFIHKADFTEIVKKAHLKARLHLPARINDLQPTFKKFYFVAWDPECRAWDNGIYLDINSFYQEGPEGMINLLAHELHHHYMDALLSDRYKRDSKDAALIALLANQQEGTADIINKQKMPTDKLGGYGPEIVKMYNDDYFSSPEVLKHLDKLTTDYLAGKITVEQYQEARKCAHFGGHTTGDYMVFLIRDQLGLQVAIDCFADFASFVRRYNEAAVKANTYVFSDTFVEHIEKVCAEMEKD